LWIVGGAFSLAGALTLAELGAMLPSAGGPYVYLRAAYGRLPAFLFGWTEFLVIRAGSIATLAAAFALYFAQIVVPPRGLDPRVYQTAVAVAAVAVLAAINVVGTRRSGGLQVVGTVLKVGALCLMITVPFFMGKAHVANLSPMWPARFDTGLLQGMMTAMVGVLWAYDGWVNTATLAEEIRDPGRNIPRSLIQGMAILIAIYLSMTIVYHLVLPMEEIRTASAEKGSPRAVAADFCRQLFGPAGVALVSLVVVCSTFISLNGNALSGPRAYFAMARDGLFPRWLCRIHPTFQTPANAIIAQAVWSILLTITGAVFLVVDPPTSGLPQAVHTAWSKLHATPLYDVMYSYVIFGGTVIYTLTITSVYVLRIRQPDLNRPYRTWGYPYTPLLYVAASFYLLYSMLQNNRFESVAGLGLILLGVPAFLVFAARSSDKELS
jgi:APA family basic amino acid/polyamine antiporter